MTYEFVDKLLKVPIWYFNGEIVEYVVESKYLY